MAGETRTGQPLKLKESLTMSTQESIRPPEPTLDSLGGTSIDHSAPFATSLKIVSPSVFGASGARRSRREPPV